MTSPPARSPAEETHRSCPPSHFGPRPRCEPPSAERHIMNAAEWLLAGDPADRADRGDVRIDYAGLRADSIRSAATLLDAGLRPATPACSRAARRRRMGHRLHRHAVGGVRPIAISRAPPPAQLADLMLDSGAAAPLEDEAARCARRQARDRPRRMAPPGGARHRDAQPRRRPTTIRRSCCTPPAPPAAPKGILHATARSVGCPRVRPRPSRCAPGAPLYSSSSCSSPYPLANAFFAGLRLGATVVDPNGPTRRASRRWSKRHRTSSSACPPSTAA